MEELYTTAEIMLATGLGRGTITNRAKLLGFKRTGRGYTFEQVMKLTTYAHRRADKTRAYELRGMLNRTYDVEHWPLRINVVNNTARIEYHEPDLVVRDGELVERDGHG